MSKYRNSSGFGGKDLFMIMVIFLFLAFCSWAGMPTLKFGFWGWPVILTLVGGIVLLFDLEDGEPASSWRAGLGIVVMVVGVLFWTLIPMFTSSVWIRTSDFRNQIGTVDQKTFSEDFSPISPEEIIVIVYVQCRNQ